MKIDLSKLKQEISKLKKIETDYEEIYLNYYSKIKEIDNEWNNIYEKRLMQNIEKEKKEMSLVHSDITELKSLYTYIYEKYSDIGKKIEIDLDKEDIIIRQLDICINHLRSVRYLCNNVDREDKTPEQIYALNSISRKANTGINSLVELRISITSIFKKIKEIENTIKTKINKINLSSVQETDISGSIEQ